MERRLITYLDNAATTFPKPPRVVDEVARFMTDCGGNAGRGSHKLAIEAAEYVFECRELLCKTFDAPGAESVSFTVNATEGLNLCIKGLLKRGDHVLISDMEHNAVYRPIYKLWSEGIIDYDIFPALAEDDCRTPQKICAQIAKRIRRNTRMLVCTGVSNICSLTMPLEEIGEFCRKNRILFIVDGAQCAGHMPISVRKMNIDALCIPGHKGMLGPQGCGAVIFGKGTMPDTLIEGGNGISSLEGEMYGTMPERYEAGTLPLPAIAGFREGIRTVNELGVETIGRHEKRLFELCREGLESIRGVKIYCPRYKGAVLLFNKEGIGAEELSARLSDNDICTRAGYHCTALGHKTLGTDKTGAVRVSFGVYNSSYDVERLCEAVQKIP